MSVSCLVGAPSAQGLFHKAIAQSGGPSGRSMEQATQTAADLCKEAGVGTVAELRGLPVDELLAAQVALAARSAALSGMALAPVVDGGLLPEHPQQAIAGGVAAGKALLVGTNRDEVRLWAFGNRKLTGGDEAYILRRLEASVGSGAADALAAYKAARADRGDSTAPIDLWTAIESDRIFRIPALRMADAHAATGTPVYDYLFDWASPAAGGILGSCHALEIPFVFGTIAEPGVDRFTGGSPEALALADKMQDAWIAFARSGDPSTDALGEWPAYDTERRATMILGSDTRVEDAPFEQERAHWS
jgi:para-nitrobenzyl esterase